MTTQPLSACCGYTIMKSFFLKGKQYYKCSECGSPCDIATPDTEELQTKMALEDKIIAIIEEYEKAKEAEDPTAGGWVLQELCQLIRTEKLKIEKAYGGCRLCYGKSYTTYRYGSIGHGEADMGDTGVYGDPITTHMNFCSCDRGKQLKELVTAEKLKLLEAVKLEPSHISYQVKDGVIYKEDIVDGIDVFRWEQGYNKAVQEINAIREKVRNNI